MKGRGTSSGEVTWSGVKGKERKRKERKGKGEGQHGGTEFMSSICLL